jgi:hypothetical protein
MKKAPLVAAATALILAVVSLGTGQVAPESPDPVAPSGEEADGNLDYGSLRELSEGGSSDLIDSVLGSGTK